MILYVGNFQSERITRRRGIPGRNAAGSHRMLRLAQALTLGGRAVEILSPATSLRATPETQHDCRSQAEVTEGIPVFYARASATPLLNMLWTIVSLIRKIRDCREELSAVIVYNFSIEFVFIALYVKGFTRARLINNVEDVSVPRWRDWGSSEVNALQQLLFFFCMKFIGYLSDGYIIPTEKFLPYLPLKGKEVSLITGCCEVTASPSLSIQIPLKILFSGKIEFEHGIELLINSLKDLDPSLYDRFHLFVCGTGHKKEWLEQALARLEYPFVEYRGFVSDAEYQTLLQEADVCLSLQNPHGRYGSFKTPSKFYEYYSHGKCVIASHAGDYRSLPPDSFLLCEPYDERTLSAWLQALLTHPQKVVDVKKRAYHHARRTFDFRTVGTHLINQLSL